MEEKSEKEVQTKYKRENKAIETKLSRRKLLGVASTAAVAGVLLGNRLGLTSQAKDEDGDLKLESDVVANANVNEASVKRIVEELMKDYEQQIAELKERLDFERDNHHANVSNSDGALTNLLNTALPYVNNLDFEYGQIALFTNSGLRQGNRNQNGKYEIDCSTFLQAVFQGITLENSAYKNNGVNYETHYTAFDFQVKATYGVGRILAHNIASKSFENGWAFEALPDFSNLRVGDLIYLHNNTRENFWRDIGHIMLVSRINQNKKITVFESVGKEPSGVVERTYTAEDLIKKKANLCARLPLAYASNHPVILNNEATTKRTGKNSTIVTEIVTSKPLQENKMYTLFLKTDLKNADGSTEIPYPIIRNTIGDAIYSFEGAVQRPDRVYKTNFFIPPGFLADDKKLIVDSSSKTNSDTYLVALYNGYVSEYVPG